MGCSQVIASDQRVTALQIKRIDEAVCKKMIEKQIMHLKLKNVNSIKDIRLDNESYEIQSGSKSFFFVSINRNSDDGNSTTCSLLLFDKSGHLKNAFDVAGPDHKSRYWSCDYMEAVSFKDYYTDGSIKIIAIYNMTPPSNEHFLLPVITKLDIVRSSLVIDESLTTALEDANVNTISEVRRYLKKHKK